MSWQLDEGKELANTDRAYEIQEELERQKEEFGEIREKFQILEPRAVGYRKAISKWYPKQLQYLGTSRTLFEALREGYLNAMDPSDKLEGGLDDMFNLEENTGAKFKDMVGGDMVQSLDNYIKDCKSHSKSVDKWQKSISNVEHYIKKVKELSSNLNIANNTGKEKQVRKLKEKFDRNKYKLESTATEHALTHDEIKLQLSKFWDARVNFFDRICKDLMFWQQKFLRGQGDIVLKSLKSLGLNSWEIDQGADAIEKQKPAKKNTAEVKEDVKNGDKEEDDFNEDDVQWAEEPSNPYAGW